ncbi:hypothetical protein QTI59_15410 [Clostridium perfringens]|nr:hypothetical protein [Clostridium perfringens]
MRNIILENIEELSLEQKISLIRKYNQMDLYTVDKYWCLQLFHLEFTANDEVDCIWESSSEDLNKLINETLEYIDEMEYYRIYDI